MGARHSLTGSRAPRRGPARLWAPAVLACLAAAMLAASCGSEEEPKKPETGGGYVDGLVKANQLAEKMACQVQLRSIWSALQAYAASNDGKYPESLKGTAGFPSDSLKCPRRPRKAYGYTAGLDSSAPASCVVAFDARPVHNGKCNVLRQDGSVVTMSPTELAAAKETTAQWIRSRARR